MVAMLSRRLISDKSAPADIARPRVSYRADLITAVLGGWFVVGLFLDAWAHNNLTELETFFTPWHGVFYSGFAATAAWICWQVMRNLLAGRRGPAAVPVGYGLAVIGLPIFTVAAVGDGVWHTVLGIETSLNILFSPTHVVGVTSMALIVTAPLRSAWGDPATAGPTAAPTVARLLPAVLTTAFATTLVLLFVQYGNALVWGPYAIVEALSVEPVNGFVDGPSPIDLVSSVAITNVVLLVPLLLLARRWRVPPGTASVVYLTVAALCGAITAFSYPEMLLMLVLAGACVDGLLAWLRPGAGSRASVLAFAALAPLVTWALFVAVAAWSVGRLPSVAEMWTGVPVTAALLGLIVGVLAAPHPPPSHPSP
jgi:hypothetical protein